MALAPTPENFRAEVARHCLSRRTVCDEIGMHPNQFSQFLTGTKPLPGWAAHNIGTGINRATGLRLIDVDMDKGVLDPPPPGRRPRWRYPHEVDPLLRSAKAWRRSRKQAAR